MKEDHHPVMRRYCEFLPTLGDRIAMAVRKTVVPAGVREALSETGVRHRLSV